MCIRDRLHGSMLARLSFSFLLLFVMAACASGGIVRDHVALQQEGFVEHKISADPFLLTSYERVESTNNVAHVYIEGDGRAWLSKRRASLDPTPRNPVAFKLARLDPADNVIYLARPCQYSRLVYNGACPQKYWTSHRFAPEVIDSMDVALSDMKQRHGVSGFHLIGFSGGGNVAALLAARRGDVLSIRTVAGNLDHVKQAALHKVSQMPHSLNAKDVANYIRHIPQVHFIGGQDDIVPYPIYASYKKAVGDFPNSSDSLCVQSHTVQSASHNRGWSAVWSHLLTDYPYCAVTQ